MKTRLTLFMATLVQDSALSMSGLDRESTADQPFTIIDGVPVLSGRALKGAAVAMAKRFFDPLPRAVSDDIKNGALRRSAWEFADAMTEAKPVLRAGVGIRHKTGARAMGVLYDREVIPAGTKWTIELRVDWSQASGAEEGHEAEGILGYVLAQHWAKGRCWIGGGVARGLGWCHVEDLKAYRFDDAAYERWLKADRKLDSFAALFEIPTVAPTHPWCFRTLDVVLAFGEYRPNPNEAPWGLDMLAVGTHESERTFQKTGKGKWAKPSWASDVDMPAAFDTDRSILMEGDRPLLPGSTVRGPLRHAFSRAERAAGNNVKDPHLVQGKVGEDDPAGGVFGTVAKSSRVLIRDARAEGEWAAARLHMHAEDEFSAGSYGSAKRDAVRLLAGKFPVRIVIEGGAPAEVDGLVKVIDRQVALGALGHLPVGGHKTRGAGWGRWEAKAWIIDDVKKERSWEARPVHDPRQEKEQWDFFEPSKTATASIRTRNGRLDGDGLTLGEAASLAQKELGGRPLVAWWCDPTIDVELSTAPATYGRDWPFDEAIRVDEVAFFAERAVWRAARTRERARYVLIEEVGPNEAGEKSATVVYTPARLHGFRRFSSANTGEGNVLLREWHVDGEVLGFTITKEVR